jgi:pimeloyl-ACP methyl ester carboxylesterase
MKKRWYWILLIILVAVGLIYLLGPKTDKPDFSTLFIPAYSDNLHALEDSIRQAESALPLKKDNEARLVWSKPYEKTPYSMVYLHGNAASQEEGDPIHEALAHRYGCNLFLSRLADHGLKVDHPMIDIEAEEWMQSALNALAVGHQIGDKVIIVSTSTGSTLGLYLAARYPDMVDGHIMMSPNIDLYDPRSSLLTRPWGLQIARRIMKSDYYGWKAPGPAQDYWYTSYRIEGLCALKSMINATMHEETFRQINDPLIMVYYYHDESNQDKIVSVKRMREMYDQSGTPSDQKMEAAVTDARGHIIGSDIFNDNLDSVWMPLTKFCEEVLRLKMIHDTGWKSFLDQRN